jgi:hypothetical protein
LVILEQRLQLLFYLCFRPFQCCLHAILTHFLVEVLAEIIDSTLSIQLKGIEARLNIRNLFIGLRKVTIDGLVEGLQVGSDFVFQPSKGFIDHLLIPSIIRTNLFFVIEALGEQMFDYLCHFIHLPAKLLNFGKFLHIHFINLENSFLLLIDIVLTFHAKQVGSI